MTFYEARKNAHLTMAEVAKALDVTLAAVSMWESGKTKPRTALLPKLAKIYGVTVDELLKDEEASQC